MASNARSRVVFQCGQEDATYLAREFAPFDAARLMSLQRYEAAARLVIDGRTSLPFALRTLPPAPARGTARPDEVRASSAATFGQAVSKVDAELRAAMPSDALKAVKSGYRLAKATADRAADVVGDELRASSVRVTEEGQNPQGIGHSAR